MTTTFCRTASTNGFTALHTRKPNQTDRPIRVVELFAGIGGFRYGLKQASPRFTVVWSNQYEPTTKKQDASEIYTRHFGSEGHSNEDIRTVSATSIPDHDLLVAGFPCQDYSILNKTRKGILGTKGSLWWELHRILKAKRPEAVLLENVDGILNTPKGNKGSDFATILTSLGQLGYRVEWQVINAADYGMPQRRRRIFILGFQRELRLAGTLREAFPLCISGPVSIVPNVALGIAPSKRRPFLAYGILNGTTAASQAYKAAYAGTCTTLADILVPFHEVPERYHVPEHRLARWKQAKSKRTGIGKNLGTIGGMPFPDPIDRPSRTIITKESGSSPTRETHLIMQIPGRYRRLMPCELERLMMLPDGYTEGLAETKRGFVLGNAVVTGVVERIGKVLAQRF